MKRKIFSLLLAVTLFTTAFTGCQKPTEFTTVRLNEVVHSIFFAPMYAAINKGFFTDEGLKIEISTGQGADKTMTAMIANNCDIGLAGPEASIYVLNQGKEDYPQIFAQLTKRDGSFLVGRNEEKDFKWSSLAGKTIIGGRPGGVPEMTLEYTLKEAGLIPGEDVNIITNLQFTATAGAFISGTADYVALFEPTASMLVAEGKGYIVSAIGEESGEIPYTAFFASQKYISQNKETIEKFTAAIYKAQKWIIETPSAEVAEIIKPFFPDGSLEILTTVIDRYKSIDAWCTTPLVDEAAIDRLQNIMLDAKVIETKADFNKLVNNSFANKVIGN